MEPGLLKWKRGVFMGPSRKSQSRSLKERCSFYLSQGSTFLHPDIFPTDIVTKIEVIKKFKFSALWRISCLWWCWCHSPGQTEFAVWTFQLLVFGNLWGTERPEVISQVFTTLWWNLSPYRKSILKLHKLLFFAFWSFNNWDWEPDHCSRSGVQKDDPLPCKILVFLWEVAFLARRNVLKS